MGETPADRQTERRDESRRETAACSDEELMRRIRDGDDTGAFDEFVARFSGELRRYLRHYLHDADAADDVMQTVFEHAYRHRDQYRPGRRVRPWLYGIATHAAIDWLRANAREARQSLDQPLTATADASGEMERLMGLVAADVRGPASDAEQGEHRALLRRAVRNLPEGLRSVVVLVSLLGMKQRDAADTLDIPLGTVKSRFHEAIRRLRSDLAAPRRSNDG